MPTKATELAQFTRDLVYDEVNKVISGVSASLADTGVTAASYGSSTAVPVITVDSKGRITAATTAAIDGLPSQSGNSGKYLTTNGTAASWDTLTTDDVAEGTNLYYTTARWDTQLATKSTTNIAEGTNLYYTSARANSDFDTRLATKSTTNLAEGTNLYYTDSRARLSVSVTDSGGDGALSYNNSTGVITYTGPSASEVRSHFSAGSGITVTDGVIAHNDTSSVSNLASDNANGTVIQDINYTFDTFGHVTAASVSTIDLDGRYYTETEADSRFVNTAGDTMTEFLTLHADPTQALHAVPKQYVDNVAAGLKAAPAVEVATTANLSATYSNGTNGVGATLTATANGAFPAIDGVTVATTTPGLNGILVKNQSNAAHNGRYNLTQVGDAGTPWILTRCGVCDQNTEIPGSYVFVKAGTTLSNTGWVAYVASPSTFTVGTDNITYFQFSGAGTYTAGTGLSLVGNQFSIDSTVATLSGTQTLTNKTISGSSNTLSNIGNSSLTNSSVTVNGTAINLGSSATITAANPNALTIGTGLSGTSYTGASAVTIAIDSTVATLTGTQTLTNKTIAAGSNTITGLTNSNLSGSAGITNANLANSSITINGTAISLGGSVSNLALTTGNLSQFAATTSAQLAGVISDETGSGVLVFGTSPSFTTDIRTPKVTTSGATNLVLDTNTGTTTGSITIAAGANGNISLTPNGTGKVSMSTTQLYVTGASAISEGLLKIENTGSTTGAPAARIINTRGNHSYGVVAEFTISSASDSDRPSILFYGGQAAHSWQVGMGQSGTNNFHIGYRASNTPASFAAWPTSYITVKTDGNVGINNTDPEFKLDVAGTVRVGNGTNFATNDGGVLFFSNNDYKIGFDGVGGTVGYIRYNVDAADTVHGHMFSAGSIATPTNLMYIRGDGNVGVGIITPNYKLDVNGTLNASGTITQNGTAVSLSGHTHSYLPLTGGTLDTADGEIILSPTGWRASDRAAIKIRSKANSPAEIDLRHTVGGVESGWHISARGTSESSQLQFYRFNMNTAGAADSSSFIQMFTFGPDGAFNAVGAITQNGSQVLHAGNFSSYAVPTRNRTNWNDSTVINNVIGQLSWKQYGNSHTIFDSSAGTSPDGGSINRYTPAFPVDRVSASSTWGEAPTLMGWNGSDTYGVRVDYARKASIVADISDTAPTGIAGAGQLWWESDTGKLKIYYNDGTSSQWVDAVPIPDLTTYYSKAGGAISGPVVCQSSLTTTILTSGGTNVAGTVRGQWTLTAGSTWGSLSADLAEWYTSDEEYEYGTVVVFGGAFETTTSTKANDHRVAGVVSKDPGFVLNAGVENTSVCIALQGKVPVKVIGRVSKGDLLVTSNIPGVATANNNAAPYTVIGKAIENKDSEEQGMILVSVGR